MLEMRFEIVECLYVKEMFGCFSEVVAPLAPVGCNFDGSVDDSRTRMSNGWGTWPCISLFIRARGPRGG